MEPTIANEPQRTIVGMGATFISILSPDANNHEVIPELWNRFVKRIGEIPNRINDVSIGVCMDLPYGVTRTHPDEFFYVAGVEVSEADDLPEGLTAYTVPASTFATFTHKGPVENLGQTIGGIYNEWLPSSGKQRRADLPDVEVYDQRFNPMSEESEMEVKVPIW